MWDLTPHWWWDQIPERIAKNPALVNVWRSLNLVDCLHDPKSLGQTARGRKFRILYLVTENDSIERAFGRWWIETNEDVQ